jgi:hypothetical protein
LAVGIQPELILSRLVMHPRTIAAEQNELMAYTTSALLTFFPANLTFTRLLFPRKKSRVFFVPKKWDLGFSSTHGVSIGSSHFTLMSPAPADSSVSS